MCKAPCGFIFFFLCSQPPYGIRHNPTHFDAVSFPLGKPTTHFRAHNMLVLDLDDYVPIPANLFFCGLVSLNLTCHFRSFSIFFSGSATHNTHLRFDGDLPLRRGQEVHRLTLYRLKVFLFDGRDVCLPS